VVDCSVVIKLYSSRCSKSLELGYEDIKSAWSTFELDKVIECLLLPIGVGKGVLEYLFELCPVDFFSVHCSSCDASLELGHLLFFPGLHHIPLHVSEHGGDMHGWVAHGFILSVGKFEDAKCN